jgi:Flp pilus assembly protein TadG
MIELAIVLPILILLVFGVIDFGIGYNHNVELRGAVREGARALALNASETAAQAEDAVKSAAYGLDRPSISFPSNPVTCGPGDGARGKSAQITATYPVKYILPFLPVGTSMSVTGVMRCET